MPGTKDRTLRVLWLIKGLGAGGAERLLVLHARTRSSRVVPTVAYLLPHKSDLVAPMRAEGVESVCLGTSSRTDLSWIRALRRLLLTEHFDIVHIHSPLAAIGCRLVLRTIPPGQRPAVVVTEHNVWESHTRLTRFADRISVGRGEKHIAVSSAVRASLPRGLRRRTCVVRHGVDAGEIRAATSARSEMRTWLGIADTEVLVGTVANLRWTKGYPELMRAARVVLDQVPNVSFAVVGRGPLEQELRSLHASLGLGERFLLLGHRPDAHAVMSSFDIFCLPSRKEGLPIALMEALVLGLPVVATKVGGIEEVVTDREQGLLVPAGEPEQLAAALLTLIRDRSLRSSMSRRAREAGDTLGIDHTVEEIEHIYREIGCR
jgi:glycosyltransferase involved in cell wall biosynthesis